MQKPYCQNRSLELTGQATAQEQVSVVLPVKAALSHRWLLQQCETVHWREKTQGWLLGQSARRLGAASLCLTAYISGVAGTAVDIPMHGLQLAQILCYFVYCDVRYQEVSTKSGQLQYHAELCTR